MMSRDYTSQLDPISLTPLCSYKLDQLGMGRERFLTKAVRTFCKPYSYMNTALFKNVSDRKSEKNNLFSLNRPI